MPETPEAMVQSSLIIRAICIDATLPGRGKDAGGFACVGVTHTLSWASQGDWLCWPVAALLTLYLERDGVAGRAGHAVGGHAVVASCSVPLSGLQHKRVDGNDDAGTHVLLLAGGLRREGEWNVTQYGLDSNIKQTFLLHDMFPRQF